LLHDDDAKIGAELDRWVQNQLAPWQHAGLKSEELNQSLDWLNEHCREIFVLDVTHGVVSVLAKKKFFSDLSSAARMDHVAERALVYQGMLQRALTRHGLTLNLRLGLDVADFVPDRSVPVFSFQTLEGQKNLLLPDVDFSGYNWYPWPLVDPASGRVLDDPPFERKLASAIFAGSSTGKNEPLTVDDVLYAKTPRLYYAKALNGRPNISFKICNAVQCDGPDTEALLQSQEYFSSPISYEKQLQHKFIISIDGNGATCSRVVIALKSNSVLLKFQSPHVLYYFDGLVSGRDYISVKNEHDIESILAEEERRPGAHASIAENGKAFCGKYLTPHAADLYIAKLLTSYASCL
jgi:hypothetical protein